MCLVPWNSSSERAAGGSGGQKRVLITGTLWKRSESPQEAVSLLSLTMASLGQMAANGVDGRRNADTSGSPVGEGETREAKWNVLL